MNLTGGEYRHFKIGELSVGKMLFGAILCKSIVLEILDFSHLFFTKAFLRV